VPQIIGPSKIFAIKVPETFSFLAFGTSSITDWYQ
jgi:hypothetical protein